MVDSLVALRLPAVVWLASTVIVVANQGSPAAFGAVVPFAWAVFLAGIAYFLWLVSPPAR